MKFYTPSGNASGVISGSTQYLQCIYIYIFSKYLFNYTAVYMFVCTCVYSTTQILEECDNQGYQ